MKPYHCVVFVDVLIFYNVNEIRQRLDHFDTFIVLNQCSCHGVIIQK